MNLWTWIVWNSALKIFDVACTWWLRIRGYSNSFNLWSSFSWASRRNLRRWSCVFIDVLQRHFANRCFRATRWSSNQSSFGLLIHKLRIIRNIWSVLIHKYKFLLWNNLWSDSNITYWRQRIILSIILNPILLF